MAVGILGLGAALPEAVRGNDFWDDKLTKRDERQRRGDVLDLRTQASGTRAELPSAIVEAMAEVDDPVFQGAKVRHVIGDDEEVSDLEARAASRALREARVDPSDIDVVLVHSLPGDHLIPSNAPAIQHKCGLTRATAWSLDVGCASFPPQLLTAASLVRSGAARHVLVVQSQCGSRVVAPENPQSIGFGDGAAAAVIGRVPDGYGLLGSYMRTDGSFRDGIVLAPVEPTGPERLWWKDGSIGPLRMATFDADVGKLAGQRGPEFCREACLGALAAAGLSVEDVSLYLGNQSVGWFVGACRRALGLPREKAFETFADVGNIGGATVLHNLERALALGRVHDGDVLLVYTPGAGFTRASAVLRWWTRGVST